MNLEPICDIGDIAGPLPSLHCSSHIFHGLLHWPFPKIPPNCPTSKNKTFVSGITCMVQSNYKFLYMTGSLCFIYCFEEPMKKVVYVQYCYHSDKLIHTSNFTFLLPLIKCTLWVIKLMIKCLNKARSLILVQIKFKHVWCSNGIDSSTCFNLFCQTTTPNYESTLRLKGTWCAPWSFFCYPPENFILGK